MPTVDRNRLKGNYAAAYVAARLSAECLVRPVATDTDVGVDLYCESIEDGEPFQHFWVQVKGGSQCRVWKKGTACSCSFTTAHLRYWHRQPVPVYAALVPAGWPPTVDPAVFIINVSDYLLAHPNPVGRKRSLVSEHMWRTRNRQDVRRFLERDVPETTARLKIRDGVIAPIESTWERYVQVMPRVPVLRFKEHILHQLRTTAAAAILALKQDGALGGEASDFLRRLARVVAQFEDNGNWETWGSRAYAAHADGDYAGAVELYDKAIASLESAPRHVRDQPGWEQIIADFEAARSRARNRENL